MALRGTLTHRKTRRLATLLKIAPYSALGILEALWHVTAEHHNDGGIGRMSNQDIADEMFYDRDADKLIEALVKAGWLESMPNTVSNGRLYVHDWHIHSDDSVNSKLIQWTKLYANGEPPRLRRLAEDSRERTIQKFEKRFGAFIGQKMRCVRIVRTDADGAHDAHGAHIQNPEPEASIQKPDSSVEPLAPPPPVEPSLKLVTSKRKPQARFDGRPLPEEWAAWARERFGWDDYQIGLTYEKFSNYWLSKGTARADWSASWRSWCLEDERRSAQPRAGPPPKSPAQLRHEAMQAGWEAID